MRVVLALGGNALLRRGEVPEPGRQRRSAARAAAVAGVAADHQVVVTHGNGPQVGWLALRAGAGDGPGGGEPLDELDAESEGLVGYLLEQELGRHLPPERLATLLTQVVVDRRDPAFDAPTKFVGPTYPEAEARRLAGQRGWSVAADGASWRRVVASPEPLRIVELATIRLLVEHGVTVTCSGGGGIPVVEDGAGGLVGVEAVVDKDLSSALLARGLPADALVLLTDVDAVYEGWGTPTARPLRRIGVGALRSLGLPAGSMGPKAEAACRFVEAGGAIAAIGALDDAARVLAGEAGTLVVP